jgi:hypothetical protein
LLSGAGLFLRSSMLPISLVGDLPVERRLSLQSAAGGDPALVGRRLLSLLL